MNKELFYAFESLRAQYGMTDQQMITCWIEFIAERMRAMVDSANE